MNSPLTTLSALTIEAQSRLMPGRDPIGVTAVQMSAAALVALPLALVAGALPTAPPTVTQAANGVALIVLGSLLPATTVVPHYSLAWIGLDSLEAAGLFTTGRLLRRGDQRYALTAAVTATAMLIDAWFDVLGSVGAGALALSVGMAVLAEIPIAAVCIYLAVNALRPHPAPAPGGHASES